MGQFIRQTSFSAGELSNLLWGRTDLPLFAKGARQMRDFFVSRSGAAVSRPGTTFVVRTKNDGQVRLVPFIYSDETSYVLEFGAGYIRFHTLGGILESAPGVPVEVTQDVNGVAVPYTVDDLATLKFAHVGNIMTIVGPNVAPYELKRVTSLAWKFSEVEFGRPALLFTDVEDPDQATTGFTAIKNAILDPLNPLILSFPPADGDHPAREWQWEVTAVVRSKETGEVFETLPVMVSESFNGFDYDASHAMLSTDNFPLYLDKNIVLRRAETAGLLDRDDTYVIEAYNIYRGRGGLFGFVGQTKSRDFVDVGEVPDYSVQPPAGNNPFRIVTPLITYLEKPWTVGFFEQRRWFGGAGLPGDNNFRRPATVFGSATGDFFNFDTRSVFDVESEAITFEFATMRREEIRHLVPRERLLVFTNGSVRSLGGGPDVPVAFNSVQTRLEDEVGSAHVVPVTVDGSVLFVRTKGTGARALISNNGDYQGVDISVHAQHLFLGTDKGIIDWCYAEDPWGVIWAVREDGALLSLTFSRDAAAWALHKTDGVFESICSVPEGAEDAVYAVVKRTINGVDHRIIERFTSRVRRVLKGDPNPVYTTTPGIDDVNSLFPTDLCLDCAKTYAGPVVFAANPGHSTITGLDELEGKSVYVIARGSPVLGPFVVAGGAITADWDQPQPNAVDNAGTPIWVAHVGLLYQPQIETLDIAGESRLRAKTVARVGFEVDDSRGLSVGQDFDNLKPWRQRLVATSWDPISAATALVDVAVKSTIDQAARAVLRQTLPLPVTVLGVTREVVVGDE